MLNSFDSVPDTESSWFFSAPPEEDLDDLEEDFDEDEEWEDFDDEDEEDDEIEDWGDEEDDIEDFDE